MAIAAVDIEPKIRALVGDVAAMTGDGLVTLERARLVTPRLGTGALRDLDGHNGDAAKLTVYVGRQERIDGKAGALRDMRPVVSARIRRCHSASRRRRHRAR